MPSELQAIGWASRPLPMLRRCASRYGDAFTLRVRRGRPWVLLSDPEQVGQVLSAGPDMVLAGAGEANPLLYPLLGPRSVMLLDEPDHLVHRRYLLPAFHGRRMRGYGEMMDEVAREQIATWPVDEPFALWPRMQAISNEVVMRAVFGRTDTQRMEELRILLRELTDFLNDPGRLRMLSTVGAGWLTRSSSFREQMRPVEEALMREVSRRRAQPERPPEEEGILSMLQDAHDENGDPMSDGELRDELVTLLSDGPTATSLAWTIDRLLRHPEKLSRLREEALADSEDTYAEAVVKEVLRLCPAVPIVMRRLVAPMRLGRYEMPADTILAPCIYLVHHREDLYEHPYRFLPERFLESPPDSYGWLPFGSGVRRCVAAQFAPLEMKRVLRAVLREVELEPASLRGSGRATRSSVSFAPADGAPVIVRRRRGGGPRPLPLSAAPAPPAFVG